MLKCCRVEDGTKISVFPGKARYFSAQDELGDYKLVEKFKPLLQEEEDQQYQLQKGDNIKIRITDPFVSIHSLSYTFLAQ
jgi:hypothetical protein